MVGKPIKGKVGKPKMKKLQLEETMPSPFGRRIVPQITSAMKADASRKLLKKKKVNQNDCCSLIIYYLAGVFFYSSSINPNCQIITGAVFALFCSPNA